MADAAALVPLGTIGGAVLRRVLNPSRSGGRLRDVPSRNGLLVAHPQAALATARWELLGRSLRQRGWALVPNVESGQPKPARPTPEHRSRCRPAPGIRQISDLHADQPVQTGDTQHQLDSLSERSGAPQVQSLKFRAPRPVTGVGGYHAADRLAVDRVPAAMTLGQPRLPSPRLHSAAT
jgi:hypothetical protein